MAKSAQISNCLFFGEILTTKVSLGVKVQKFPRHLPIQNMLRGLRRSQRLWFILLFMYADGILKSIY